MGPENFERLCLAMVRRLVGPNIEVFGRGPDGGREATFSGSINWSISEEAPDETWTGYSVFQVKHRSAPSNTDGYSWLRNQISSEFKKWERKGSKRSTFPEYIIFISNAPLSAVSRSGGIDKIDSYIRSEWERSLRALGLKGWKVWHRDFIVNELNAFQELRAGFPGLLTAGDILSRLERISILPPSTTTRDLLVESEQNALKTERWVNFSEAGGEKRTSIEQVAIDLPCTVGGKRVSTLACILDRSKQVLKRSLCPKGTPRHIVLTGAPGNGKSTITRFVAQYFRADFLKDDLAPGMVSNIANDIERAKQRLSLDSPLNTRWPLYVPLTGLADSSGPGNFSFFTSVARMLGERTQEPVTPAWLKNWLKTWPWLIIFDGLDEVTSISARRRILDIIENFRDEVDALDADVLMIVTTRPTGYSADDRLSSEHFLQHDLTYLDASEALQYGKHLTSIRLADDPERAGNVIARLRDAVTDEASLSLTRTPLQVLIMTIILERFMRDLPSDRYQLFWGYYETIYSREASKPLSRVADLLTEHRHSITAIHARVGLELQHKSEEEGEASAVMLVSRFEALIKDYLVEGLGYEDANGLATLVRELRETAMNRLVLLGARGEGIGFEVRPLQELMAARALSDGDDATLTQRLRVLAPSPHWRNTWLFVAGRIFADSQQHRWDIVTDCISTFDMTGAWPGWLCPVGPALAAQLLEEGVAHDKPRWRSKLLRVALRALGGPVVSDFPQIHRGLKAAAVSGDMDQIRGAMEAKSDGPPIDRAISVMLWSTNDFGGQIRGWTRSSPDKLNWDVSEDQEEVPLGTVFKRRLSKDTYAQERKCFGELGQLSISKDRTGHLSLVCGGNPQRHMRETLTALLQPDRSARLEAAFESLGVDQWAAKLTASGALEPYLTRVPVRPEDLGSWLPRAN